MCELLGAAAAAPPLGRLMVTFLVTNRGVVWFSTLFPPQPASHPEVSLFPLHSLLLILEFPFFALQQCICAGLLSPGVLLIRLCQVRPQVPDIRCNMFICSFF